MRRIILLLSLLVALTGFAKRWTEKRVLSNLEVDEGLKAFITDSILPIRALPTWGPGCITILGEVEAREDPFVHDLGGKEVQGEGKIVFKFVFGYYANEPYEGYAVIDNVIMLFPKTALSSKFVKKKEGEKLNYVIECNDDPFPLDNETEDFIAVLDENGYRLIYRPKYNL